MLIGNPRLGALSQLPENFDKLSPEEKVKAIDALPREKRGEALLHIYNKLTPEEQAVWRNWMFAYLDTETFNRDATRLFVMTLASFLYDGFLLRPADRASAPVRSAAYVGSAGVAGLVSYQSYKVFTNPVSPTWVQIISAFVGVFSAVDAVARVVEIFSRPGVPAPVFSPKATVVAAISGRKRPRA